MDEADFWARLEYRVCRELAGMRDNDMRTFWCDGFIAVQYQLDDPTPRIEGRAWICNGPSQGEWAFTLFLPDRVGSRDEIAWEGLLPPEDVTRWLTLDQVGQRIAIEPSAAVPDLA